MPFPLITDRLRIRPFVMAEANEFNEIFSDPQVIPNNYSTSFHTTVMTMAWIIRYQQQNKYSLWAIIAKATNSIIGSVGFYPVTLEDSKEPKVGILYYLAPRFWGNGFATEAVAASLRYAFEELDIEHIVGHTLLEHQAARRVMEKNGFVNSGNITINGETQVLYHITEQQYQNSEL